MQQRRSTTLAPDDWRRLDDLAAATDSTATAGPEYGNPTWRALLRRIARNDNIIDFIEQELTMNIYFLEGQANSNYEADHAAVIGADTEGVLVECNFNEAGRLASEWGLSAPLLAKDGIHYSESGDANYIANGVLVDSAEDVAKEFGWTDEHYLDAEDYLREEGRVF